MHLVLAHPISQAARHLQRHVRMNLMVMCRHHHGCCSTTTGSPSHSLVVDIIAAALIINILLLCVNGGLLRWESSFKRHLSRLWSFFDSVGWLLVKLTMTQGDCRGVLGHPICTEGPLRCRRLMMMMIRLDAGLGCIVAC